LSCRAATSPSCSTTGRACSSHCAPPTTSPSRAVWLGDGLLGRGLGLGGCLLGLGRLGAGLDLLDLRLVLRGRRRLLVGRAAPEVNWRLPPPTDCPAISSGRVRAAAAMAKAIAAVAMRLASSASRRTPRFIRPAGGGGCARWPSRNPVWSLACSASTVRSRRVEVDTRTSLLNVPTRGTRAHRRQQGCAHGSAGRATVLLEGAGQRRTVWLVHAGGDLPRRPDRVLEVLSR